MKKLLIFLLTMSASIAFGTLKYNQKTSRYYSENAPKNVNQEEYHGLVCLFNLLHPQGMNEMMPSDWADIFTALRMVGTPAALRLIHDYEEMIKQYNRELARIRSL